MFDYRRGQISLPTVFHSLQIRQGTPQSTVKVTIVIALVIYEAKKSADAVFCAMVSSAARACVYDSANLFPDRDWCKGI